MLQALWTVINMIMILSIKWFGAEKSYPVWRLGSVLSSTFFVTGFLCNLLLDMFYGINLRDYIFLTGLIILLFALYYYYTQARLRERIHNINTQYDMIERQYERDRHFYNENAKLYHDMRHHLRSIERFLENSNYDGALTYIHEVQEPLKRDPILPYTGLDIVDTILYENIEEAKKEG